MKKVEVVLKTSALETFRESAAHLGISEYDVSEVRRCPSIAVREHGRVYRGHEYTLDLLSRLKVEFTVVDEDAKRVAQNLLTLIAPDSVAISTLDELISISPSAGHSVLDSRTRRGISEINGIISH